MAEVTVTCGCGRKMTQRGTDPKNTYRCGCGARVTVKVTEQATCVGAGPGGARCRFLPVRESSAHYGIALCGEHFAGFLETLQLIREGEEAREQVRISFEEYMKEGRMNRANHEQSDRAKAYAAQSVVYYVRVGELIKIGTTVNMKARMVGVMPDEILATEPGEYGLEKMRHQQFAALRVRGERFRPAPELLSHIEMIREHYGEPQITSYLGADGLPVRPVTPLDVPVRPAPMKNGGRA
jgi:hypothetical protein